MTAPARNAHMNAGAMPLRASSAVRALANVAIFIPRKPERIEVAAPTKNASVENAPLYRAGARSIPVFLSRCQAVEKPSSELRRTKMKTEKKAMKTPMYLYSVTRNEVAPSAMASMRSAAFWTICRRRGWEVARVSEKREGKREEGEGRDEKWALFAA